MVDRSMLMNNNGMNNTGNYVNIYLNGNMGDHRAVSSPLSIGIHQPETGAQQPGRANRSTNTNGNVWAGVGTHASPPPSTTMMSQPEGVTDPPSPSRNVIWRGSQLPESSPEFSILDVMPGPQAYQKPGRDPQEQDSDMESRVI